MCVTYKLSLQLKINDSINQYYTLNYKLQSLFVHTTYILLLHILRRIVLLTFIIHIMLLYVHI